MQGKNIVNNEELEFVLLKEILIKLMNNDQYKQKY